ncbi:sensor histidine kinase [Sphingomonas sp. PR090111-T3T-6A]|uniref:sensor histidine kinase n=1 Tax=Sphingomonas sp. PR090111-T3T-6A TaxID=685778 RepID=UPI000375602A|nr:PAS domain S-box protein [Sphingomonas sp. PR090111-T3T-6A]
MDVPSSLDRSSFATDEAPGGISHPDRDAAAWLAAIVENSDDAILSKKLDGIISSWNPGATRLFGFSAEEAVGRPITIIIPEDRLSEEAEIIGKIRRGERVRHFETVRQRKDGRLVDISLTVSPVRDAEGRIIGASKIARDITEAKMAAERQSLILREMNHRIKNLFALTAGLVTVSARGASDIDDFIADLSGRIASLARAHQLTLPDLAGDVQNAATTLKSLLGAILAPHEDRSSSSIHVRGEDVAVGPRSLPSLALLFHELATNAAKYGVLSASGGTLSVNIGTGNDILSVHWIEAGATGDRVLPVHEGFGSHLEKASVRGLQGSIEREWRPDGLAVAMRFPLGALAS